jgi:hypothetical protein
MDDKVKAIIRESIERLINESASETKIRASFGIHQAKVHFVPIKYRVMGGILQSLNIKFGNFIEQLIALVVESDRNVEALPISGKKIPLAMTPRTDALIDQYITQRQLPDSPDRCDDHFNELLRAIIEIETTANPEEKQSITKDVDALFRTKSGERVIYLEIKYNDDHDTGKFVDINRKLLKTYAGLVNHLEVSSVEDLTPLLYYFNPTKRYGPIYTPSSNIYRGAQLFVEFFEMDYSDIDQQLRNIGDDEEILAIFDGIYQRIRHSE